MVERKKVRAPSKPVKRTTRKERAAQQSQIVPSGESTPLDYYTQFDVAKATEETAVTEFFKEHKRWESLFRTAKEKEFDATVAAFHAGQIVYACQRRWGYAHGAWTPWMMEHLVNPQGRPGVAKRTVSRLLKLGKHHEVVNEYLKFATRGESSVSMTGALECIDRFEFLVDEREKDLNRNVRLGDEEKEQLIKEACRLEDAKEKARKSERSKAETRINNDPKHLEQVQYDELCVAFVDANDRVMARFRKRFPTALRDVAAGKELSEEARQEIKRYTSSAHDADG